MRSPTDAARKNLAGPNFAMTPNPVFFRDGKMNRDPHSATATESAPSSAGLGRTVRVDHFHYKDRS